MDVYFATDKLADLIRDDRKRRRKFGDENARWILIRLDNLRFAENLAAMFHLPGNFHPLSGVRDGTFALNLKHGYRLILEPAHDPIPRRPDGGIDLVAVTAVTVLDVEDYHD